MLVAMFCATPVLYAQQNTDSIAIARQKKLDSTRKAQEQYYDSLRIARQQVIDSTRKAQKEYNDSVQIARKRILDSTRDAQAAYYDSMRIVRQRVLDSTKAARQRISDSLTAIREYRQSDRYKDSVAAIRQARLDSIKLVRQERMDSIKAERQRITDSTVAARTAYVDSIRAIQKRRSDSLAVIREYRQSARYKDSVAVVRKLRLDSIKAERKAYYDSVAAVRQKFNDSVAAARKAYTDSLTAARIAYTDSLKEVRQIRADSIAKIREKREKDKKLREKQREEKAQLALELKIKKKREAWSNEQMLKKRWRFPRSMFQNGFTRYNYYFNADRKMDEALENMLRFRQESYDSLLALYPYDPDRDSSVLSADMDSIINKASVGIQIHDPRTKWGDDLYLLLGQAYYYKGDYKNAADAFKYVVSLRQQYEKEKNKKKKRGSKEKATGIVQEEEDGFFNALKHRTVHNQAILWLARTYTEENRQGEAETILDLVESDPNFAGSLAGRVALEKSYIRLTEKDYNNAPEHLGIVSKDKELPDWIRMRAAYINGQLLQRQEQYEAAAESYRTALSLHPELEMDFYAKKNIATSMMLAGGKQEEAIDLLENVLKDTKYIKYHEQVYYVLGRLAENSGDKEQAIVYLKDGIASPKATNEQKALSFATLGNIYYDTRRYEEAKAAYDSASALFTTDGPIVTVTNRRSLALSSLTEPLRVIKDNDSLLALAALDEKDQRSVVRKYIKMLEQRRADSIFMAQNAGLEAAKGNTNNRKNNYANWYFTNAVQMQKGLNSFKQKWGNRPLVDNWRRLSSGGFAGDRGDGDEDGNDSGGIPTEESLLAAIPNDEKSRNEAIGKIQEAYIDAANAYVKELEDYDPGKMLLDTFEQRFPSNTSEAEVLYLRYLIALRQQRVDEAKTYSAKLLSEYPDSEWAKIVKPTEDGAGMVADNSGVVQYYDKTYSMLLQHEYAASLNRAREGQRRFTVPVYKDRFQIIEAISLAKLENFVVADSVLTIFMTAHTDPNDSLRRWADAVLQYVTDAKMAAARTGGTLGNKNNTDTTAGNNGGTDNDADVAKKSSNSGTTASTSSAPAAYKYNASDPHKVIFTFANMESRTKGVEAAIKDFNKFKFGSLDLTTDIQMLSGNQGVVAISSFRNKNQALIYMNTLKKTKQIFREYNANEYKLMMISDPNYDKLLNDKSLGGYILFYGKKY